jgi:hypothetical protein
MKYKHLFSTLLAIGVLNSVSFAGLGQGQYTINIENLKQAEKLREGTKVAFVCEECKTFKPAIIDKKKSFLSFFTANATHGCPGCRGQVTLKAVSGQTQNITVYTHVCTKCGANSAYTCAAHE